MKVLILTDWQRYEKFMPELPITRQVELLHCARETDDEEVLARAGDAEIILTDAVRPIRASLMARMPQLKMVHCEGVGFDRMEVEFARERGIFVCNSAGCNAPAVAEQAILLMLALLRRALPYDRGTREGRQAELMGAHFLEPLTELGACTVGLVGFGDSARALAERLRPFGCKLFYHAPHRRSAETEAHYGATYLPLAELAAASDILSLHCPANASTHHLVDAALLRRMRPTALLINTARGDVVDSAALLAALAEGRLAGAGLDTLFPEPAPADHPLFTVSAELADRLVFSPHVGGMTTDSFRRAHQMIWEDVAAIAAGRRPARIVNGL